MAAEAARPPLARLSGHKNVSKNDIALARLERVKMGWGMGGGGGRGDGRVGGMDWWVN